MILTLEIPDAIALRLTPEGGTCARAMLEDSAVEAYRQGRLSAYQVREMLGHDSRWQTEAFLAERQAFPHLSAEEILADAQNAAAFRVLAG